MADPMSLPLYEKFHRKNSIPRAIELVVLFLLFSLLAYRFVSLKHHGLPWLLAFFCECCFTFNWILVVNSKWNQVKCISYPQRLLQRKCELPGVDMFVTTADAALEPPILTMNTVLSLLAVDYPASKLACYLSDDGASPLTYYSLIETSKFARLWVPFCRKYEITLRAPFRYFTSNSKPAQNDPLEFQQEWKRVKDNYEELCQKIENASKTFVPCELAEMFEVFSKIDKRNHPTIVKVIIENEEPLPNGLPHLVYISREKRPKHPHHSKAGAMNVLTRVSGLMTNAPFMLNVDCDMHVNNPQVILHAMCMLLGVQDERDCAFVQFPQWFYDGLKDDPFGNQLVVLLEYIGNGVTGIQGPFYSGTNCFHRRKVIYGLSPDDKRPTNEKLDDEDVHKKFGKSKKFIESASQILSTSSPCNKKGLLGSSIEAASQVAACGYEHGTGWGTEVGWMYGSAAEDMLTGLGIHGKGWRSMCCLTDPPSFLGCVPSSGPASMTQMKRWSSGLLEILFSSKSPIFATINGKLQFRQCLAYMWLLIWGLRSIPEIIYAALPAYCIITNSHFLPKVQDPAFLIPAALFIIHNVYTLYEYLRTGLSIRAWWNNQRMARVNTMSSWLFGFFSVILQLLGLSQTTFEVTQKDQINKNDDDDDAANNSINAGKFTFDKSPVFVPGTAILLVNLTALVIGVVEGFNGVGIGEIICSSWVVLCFWAFLKGLFGKGKYGIPSWTICKSGVLALLFVNYCKRTLKA